MRTVRRWRSRSQWKFVPASTSPGRIDLSSFQSLFSNREPIISKPGYGRLRSRSGRKSLDLGIIEFNGKTLDGSESAMMHPFRAENPQGQKPCRWGFWSQFQREEGGGGGRQCKAPQSSLPRGRGSGGDLPHQGEVEEGESRDI